MTTLKQSSFSGGEISPSLYARADIAKYQTGLRTCRNFAVARHGGVFNRPGSKYIGSVKTHTKRVRLIPFVFNADQTYVLEFGNHYMRVWRNGAYVPRSFTADTWSAVTSLTFATKANPGRIGYSSAGTPTPSLPFYNGCRVVITGCVGMTELNNGHFVLKANNSGFHLGFYSGWDLYDSDGNPVDTTSYGTYVSGMTVSPDTTSVTDWWTPYAEADLEGIQFCQSADIMTIVHPSYIPMELARTSHTSWTFTELVPSMNPYVPYDTNIDTFTAGTKTLQYVVTAFSNGEESEASVIAEQTSASEPSVSTPVIISWTDDTPVDRAPRENRIYRLNNGAYGYVGSVNLEDSQMEFTDIGFTPDYTTQPPVNRYIFANYNFPSAVGYYQQRRVFGGSDNNPETAYMSKTGYPQNFSVSTPLQDDDAVTFTLSGKYVNSIRHIIELKKLIVLTSGGEWSVEGDGAGIITPTQINAKQHAYNGASTLSPIIVNGTLLYVQARGTLIRDLGFDFEVDGYRGNDLTIFSSHLFDGYTIKDWAYQQIPHSIVWVVRSDGKMLGLTYLREHQMMAWHRHDTDGLIENVCSVPEGNEDALYMVVNRTIGGATKRYIERILTQKPSALEDMVYLDSYLTYDGTPVTTVTGLSHLEGKEVSVFADGRVIASPNNPNYSKLTVTSGAVTLPSAHSVIHVGLPITADLETLDIETTQGETMSGKNKLVTAVTAFVEASHGAWFGIPPKTGEDLLEGMTEENLRDTEGDTEATDLETGVIEVNIRSEWNSNGRILIRHVDPSPLSVLAIMPSGLIPFRG